MLTQLPKVGILCFMVLIHFCTSHVASLADFALAARLVTARAQASRRIIPLLRASAFVRCISSGAPPFEKASGNAPLSLRTRVGSASAADRPRSASVAGISTDLQRWLLCGRVGWRRER